MKSKGDRFLLLRFVVGVLCLMAVPACAWGQQGGGMGSIRNASGGEDEPLTFTHILTPGDRGEWPITAKEGETIIVSASSTAFDPAIEVVDSAGKVLAQNDDVRTGDQQALVLFRFAKAGNYKVLVKGFKSKGGGEYVFTVRRFVSVDLPLGGRLAGSLSRSGVKWFRFPVAAGQTLVVTARAANFQPVLDHFAPNGEAMVAAPQALGTQRARRMVFRTETAGDTYVKLGGGRPGASYAITLAAAQMIPTTIDAKTTSRRLEAGGLDVWTFQGKPGDVVLIEARATGAKVKASLGYVPTAAKAGEQATSSIEPGADVVFLPYDLKASGDMVALLRREGTYHATVSQPLGLSVEYTMAVSRKAKSLPETAEVPGTLKIGGSDYWTVEGARGRILRLEALAEQFDVTLTLFNPQGEQVAANDDGGAGHNALLTTILTDAGRYLLRVSVFGDGGSGTYRVRRITDPIRSLTLGERGPGTIGVGGTGIWSLQGKAGQTIVLSVRSRDFDTAVRLFGPDGLEVANNDDSEEGTDSLLSVRLPLDGVYTIWVSGKQGSGQYVVRCLDLDG